MPGKGEKKPAFYIILGALVVIIVVSLLNKAIKETDNHGESANGSELLTISFDRGNYESETLCQTFTGKFTVPNGNKLESAVCRVTNTEYASEGVVTGCDVNNTNGTWSCTDARLYPGTNTVKVICEDSDANTSYREIVVTYVRGELMDYPQENLELTGETSGYINNIILIFLEPGLDAVERDAALDKVCEKTGGSVVGNINGAGMYQIQVSKRGYEQLDALCVQIGELEHILGACCDVVVTDEAVPNDPWYEDPPKWNEENPDGSNWWAEAVNLLSAWEYKAEFGDIIVGIADSGVDNTHEDLKHANIIALNKIKKTAHGTHVAGIIGATQNNGRGMSGVIPDPTLCCYDVRSESIFSGISLSWILDGIDMVIAAGAKVVNLSQGIAGKTVIDPETTTAEYAVGLIKSWEKNYGDDFIIVQAAGNHGGDSTGNGMFASITDGKALDHVIIVGNAQMDDDEYRMSWNSGHGKHVTIAAPGTEIYSTVPGGYEYFDGTSMAAPIVTGVAALVWSIYPELSAAEVKNILVSTATREVLGFKDNSRKYPMVDACASVKKAIEIRDKAYTVFNSTYSGVISRGGTRCYLQMWQSTTCETTDGHTYRTDRIYFSDSDATELEKNGLINANVHMEGVAVNKDGRGELHFISYSILDYSTSGETSAAPDTSDIDSADGTAGDFASAYASVLSQFCNDHDPEEDYYNNYTLYDMNEDGIPELIIQTGTCEADRMYVFYTLSLGKDSFIGQLSASHSTLYGCGAMITQMDGHMGWETCTIIHYQGSSINAELIYDAEVESYWSDICGVQELAFYRLDDKSGLNWVYNPDFDNWQALEPARTRAFGTPRT